MSYSIVARDSATGDLGVFLVAAEHGDPEEARCLLVDLEAEQPRYRRAAIALSKHRDAAWLQAAVGTEEPRE